jgi:5'-nucleotidase / UDP-sugar diphosphatase
MNKKLFLFVFALLFPIAIFSAQESRQSFTKEDANTARRFTVLFTGDTHSHLDQIQRIAHTILMEKQNPENGDLVVADIGDMLTGTEYFEVSKGVLEFEMMNLAGYQIATIGNHEFDVQWPQLKTVLDAAKFDIVCANVYDETTTLIAEPYKIYTVGSLKIAFLGIMGLEAWKSIRPSAKLGLSIGDPDSILDELLPQLELQADVIIVLSHSGITTDRQLAAKHVQIDAILGGHSHTYMDVPELIQVTGENKQIPVFHSSRFADYLGKFTMEVVGKEKRHHAQLIKMDSSKDPKGSLTLQQEQIRDRLVAVSQKLEEVYSKVIAACVKPLFKEEIKKGVGPLGRDFICHIFREVTGSDVAFYPTGGIRNGLEYGPITLKTIVNMIPSDRLVTYKVKGAYLRLLMQDGESRWALGPRTFQNNGIDINTSTQEITVNGKPLQDEALYRVSGPMFFFERELIDISGNILEKYAGMADSQYEEYPDDTSSSIINWLQNNDLSPYTEKLALFI